MPSPQATGGRGMVGGSRLIPEEDASRHSWWMSDVLVLVRQQRVWKVVQIIAAWHWLDQLFNGIKQKAMCSAHKAESIWET